MINCEMMYSSNTSLSWNLIPNTNGSTLIMFAQTIPWRSRKATASLVTLSPAVAVFLPNPTKCWAWWWQVKSGALLLTASHNYIFFPPEKRSFERRTTFFRKTIRLYYSLSEPFKSFSTFHFLKISAPDSLSICFCTTTPIINF